MDAEYKKAAEKLLCGITDKRLHEPAIWNDILSSVRSGKLRLCEINDEILRIKYFCKEKIKRASAFTESDKSGVRLDDLNAYFVEAIKSRDKGYFEAFIRAYEPVLQSRAERFVSHYNLSADDTEDIKQIFLGTLWFAFLGYDAADPIPLLQYVKKAAVVRQLDYIRTTKNACTVPTQNGYAELRKVMRIYNRAPELSADACIALAVKETGFAEKKVTELVAVGKACEYPIGIVLAEENESAADGTVADELIEDPSVSLFEEVLRSIYRDNFRTAADKITPKDIKSFKILAAYHQYFAVRKAIESTKHATVTDGKGGVFWHTQGSGKSLSMVFYAHLLQDALDSPTIVVLTDRNDLDDQLYGQFAKCKKFLRQEPIHAESREHLKTLLAGRQANGIIFTTMQKFEESHEPLSERRNIVVMADEAHRGQYGLAERIKITTNEDGEEVAKRVVGTARIIRNSLPNATYIGFTGTPISSKDRSTREVFGDYRLPATPAISPC